MIQAIKLAALTLLLTACATAPEARRERALVANPTALIAAELAFAKLAQDKGQWTAFRATAAPGAEMFVPQRTLAGTFLKGRPDPAKAVTWQPHAVWMNCDGSYGVTRGAMQRPAGPGYFTTVWQRQKDGSYKWILDQADMLAEALPAPDMISAKVASCSGIPPIAQTLPLPPGQGPATSDDRTLGWIFHVDPQCGQTYRVMMWDGAQMAAVLTGSVAPPPVAERPAGGCG